MKLRTFTKYLYTLPCILFCAVVLHLSLTNIGCIANLSKNGADTSLAYLTNSAEQVFRDTIVQKYDFIELNGAMAKALGYNTLNDTTRLENGALGGSPSQYDSYILAERIHSLSDFLTENNVNFLCVPVSRKAEFYDALPAAGYQLHPDAHTEFLTLLDEYGVNTLDMNTWFRENGWGIDHVYFRTDHHWKPEAAFEAVRQIMANFEEQFGLEYDRESLDLSNWSREVYSDWFLGSQGKRTGRIYAGLDDLSYIYPNFPTDIHVARVNALGQIQTAYESSLYYDAYYLSSTPSYYTENPYCLYMGGDFPYVYVKNTCAVHNKKIAIVGDSYLLPAETFLATQFSELYRIDMRYYSNGTFTELVQQIDPDYVLLLFSGSADDPRHNYSTASWQENYAGKTLSDPILTLTSISLSEAKNNQDYHLLTAEIAPGAYSLSLENTVLTRNFQANPESPGMLQQASVIDLNTNTAVATRYFLANEQARQNWLFTVPDDPDAHYAIVLYNGANQYTLGNTSEAHNLTLSQYN